MSSLYDFTSFMESRPSHKSEILRCKKAGQGSHPVFFPSHYHSPILYFCIVFFLVSSMLYNNHNHRHHHPRAGRRERVTTERHLDTNLMNMQWERTMLINFEKAYQVKNKPDYLWPAEQRQIQTMSKRSAREAKAQIPHFKYIPIFFAETIKMSGCLWTQHAAQLFIQEPQFCHCTLWPLSLDQMSGFLEGLRTSKLNPKPNRFWLSKSSHDLDSGRKR